MRKCLQQLANNQIAIYESTRGKAVHEFYSYGTFIARYEILLNEKNKLTLSSYYDYSRTTSKYLKIFLNDYCDFYYKDTKELTRLINKGGCDNVIVKVID